MNHVHTWTRCLFQDISNIRRSNLQVSIMMPDDVPNEIFHFHVYDKHPVHLIEVMN